MGGLVARGDLEAWGGWDEEEVEGEAEEEGMEGEEGEEVEVEVTLMEGATPAAAAASTCGSEWRAAVEGVVVLAAAEGAPGATKAAVVSACESGRS